MARTGCQWRLLPSYYGCWRAIHRRFKRWACQGIWEKLMQYVQKNKDLVSGLKNVSAELITQYGKLSNHWKIENGLLYMETVIPVNTNALIYIPTGNAESIKEGNTFIANNSNIIIKAKQTDYTIVEVGSGTYAFSCSQ